MQHCACSCVECFFFGRFSADLVPVVWLSAGSGFMGISITQCIYSNVHREQRSERKNRGEAVGGLVGVGA